MLQLKPQNDPVVEILQLAYRRGLIVLQEQATRTAEGVNLDQVEKPIVGKSSPSDRDVTGSDALPLIGRRNQARGTERWNHDTEASRA